MRDGIAAEQGGVRARCVALARGNSVNGGVSFVDNGTVDCGQAVEEKNAHCPCHLLAGNRGYHALEYGGNFAALDRPAAATALIQSVYRRSYR